MDSTIDIIRFISICSFRRGLRTRDPSGRLVVTAVALKARLLWTTRSQASNAAFIRLEATSRPLARERPRSFSPRGDGAEPGVASGFQAARLARFQRRRFLFGDRLGADRSRANHLLTLPANRPLRRGTKWDSHAMRSVLGNGLHSFRSHARGPACETACIASTVMPRDLSWEMA
jgi:hypothetical protein